MVNPEKIRELLAAFAALFTQPVDQQDLPTSLRSAAVSIGLVTLGGVNSLIQNGVRSAGEIVVASLLVVLLWMLGTGVVVQDERRKLVMARNLNLLSFWIAATLILVFLAAMLYPNPLDKTIRWAACYLPDVPAGSGSLVPKSALRPHSVVVVDSRPVAHDGLSGVALRLLSCEPSVLAIRSQQPADPLSHLGPRLYFPAAAANAIKLVSTFSNNKEGEQCW